MTYNIPLEGPITVIDDKVHKDLTKNSQIRMWCPTKEGHLKTPKFDEKYNSSPSSVPSDMISQSQLLNTLQFHTI